VKPRSATVAWRLAAGLAALVGVAGLWLHAYAPRERPGSPSARARALLAWAAERWDVVVWVPHPHQNLGAFGELVGDLESYLAAGAQASGRPVPRWPAFGPFALPPGRELVVAVSGDGRGFFTAARVDPPIAWLARLAGRLAGNPWLAGGVVQRGESRVRVSWDEGFWSVTPAGAEPPPAADVTSPRARPPEPQDLGHLALARSWGPLPPGDYRLARQAGELELRSGPSPPGGSSALAFDSPGLVLWASESEPGPVGGPGIFLLWEGAEGVLPRAAVLQRGGGQVFQLPAERLLELFGQGARVGRRLGWSIRATDRQGRGAALGAVPWFERHLPRAGERPWLAAALRLEPRRAGDLLRRVATALENLPLVPARDRERWQAGALLLRPFGECGAITLEVWRQPESVRLRLCPPRVEGREFVESSSDEDSQIDEGADLR